MEAGREFVLEGIEATELLEFGEQLDGKLPTVLSRKADPSRFGSQDLLTVLLPYAPAVLSFLAVYLARKQASSRAEEVAEMERRPDGTVIVRVHRTQVARSSEAADPKLVEGWLSRLKDLVPG